MDTYCLWTGAHAYGCACLIIGNRLRKFLPAQNTPFWLPVYYTFGPTAQSEEASRAMEAVCLNQSETQDGNFQITPIMECKVWFYAWNL